MLIIGSKSFNKNFPEQNKHYKDVDVIGYRKDITDLIKKLNPLSIIDKDNIVTLRSFTQDDTFDRNQIEILVADKSESLKMYLDYDNAHNGLKFARPEVLFSLKKSHINFPIFFNKHISDYEFLHDHFDGIDKLSHITKINFKETEDRIGKLKAPSLNKSVKEFFDQSNNYVKSYFVHDDIHQAVKHFDVPLYMKMQKDLTQAKCEKTLWDKFTFEEKSKCVLEEAYVIALERKVLPFLFGGKKYFSSNEAFDWSLQRICTTLCSGWFREFATNNFSKIKKYYNTQFVEDFLSKVEDNQIKRIV